jgi:hypothetical protein
VTPELRRRELREASPPLRRNYFRPERPILEKLAELKGLGSQKQPNVCHRSKDAESLLAVVLLTEALTRSGEAVIEEALRDTSLMHRHGSIVVEQPRPPPVAVLSPYDDAVAEKRNRFGVFLDLAHAKLAAHAQAIGAAIDHPLEVGVAREDALRDELRRLPAVGTLSLRLVPGPSLESDSAAGSGSGPPLLLNGLPYMPMLR